MLKIGIDFDGVIANARKLKSKTANLLFGIDIPSSQFTRKMVVGAGLLSAEQYLEIQKKIYLDREIGLSIEPIEGALKYISRLLDEKYSVEVITARHGISLDIGREWAKRHSLMVKFTGIGYGNEKDSATIGMDVFVDDKIERLIPLVKIVPNLFLLHEGNLDTTSHSLTAAHVTSWRELYYKIRNI